MKTIEQYKVVITESQSDMEAQINRLCKTEGFTLIGPVQIGATQDAGGYSMWRYVATLGKREHVL